MNTYLRFLLFGILFVGTQEFWVTFLWRGELFYFFLAVVFMEIPFLTIMWFIAKKTRPWITYLVSGVFGLVVIEWLYAGNLPGGEASQFVMFTTWAGATLFALMYTDGRDSKVKNYAMKYFLTFTGLATALGLVFFFANPQISFVITYWAAIIGYPIMTIFFIWYLIGIHKNYRS